MQKLSKNKLIWASILVAWIFDQILWRRHFGISFLMLVVIVMLTGYILARSAGVRPARTTWLLVPAILFFAVMTIFRSEPLTVLLNVAIVISSDVAGRGHLRWRIVVELLDQRLLHEGGLAGGLGAFARDPVHQPPAR